MTESEIAVAAEILAQARRSGMQIEGLPVTPSSVAEAHEIQDRVATLVGQPIGAFKAGAPPEGEPTRGLIEARMIRSSPAHMSVVEVPHLGVEGEVAFRFTRDLPARAASYTREEIAQSVAVLPVIEVVSSRFREPLSRPKLEQLADCGINGGLVLGPEMADWSHLDLPNLQMTFIVNGETRIERKGGHPTDDPIAGAVALANMMRAGGGVKVGQIVTTGSWTGLPFLKPGDRCVVRFEKLGEAEIMFVG
ncbi:2-keto-4-pentenoate hydratase [Bradyrhizobium sp. NFR13]|jgi:2-keto-4-pentenoate hydratase|uniref:2-keto-4-pentenoate hydratase n=1 Tax=Bradyrhizobium sp. NFR13 TaxID=1566285 RepID=UPI0008E38BCD|nr:fumarylacetoacetate hydrolase family protein [Bradyrhizobium sp. NFR13]SFM23314.1 2-keto-4-pentenoate hydratase [Bradyrhizobium sp. NFR13]